jgi:ABC-type glycerol-3-phosphate transport system substrate-binding protein
LTRRAVLQGAALTAPFVRGAHAAGVLNVGFADHPVPGANAALAALCREWAAREKVEISIDFIAAPDGLRRTEATEAAARMGHDVLTFETWTAALEAERLEPLDDVMPALVAANGSVDDASIAIARRSGTWTAAPATVGGTILSTCGRIDLLRDIAGFDPAAAYPDGKPADAERWTWDFFFEAAQKLAAADHRIGVGFGITGDSTAWVDTVLRSHGAALIDPDGAVAVKSDAMRQVLEYFQRLVPLAPKDAFAWDDAANDKALRSGGAALIFDTPAARAAASPDAPKLAEQLWSFPPPRGPEGRFVAALPAFWGVWKFSPHKSAAKSLIAFLCRRASVERTVAASQGCDLPPFEGLRDLAVWSGAIYHYPPRHDVTPALPYSPMPARFAERIYREGTATRMIAKCTKEGQTVAQAIDWAAAELESFSRS